MNVLLTPGRVLVVLLVLGVVVAGGCGSSGDGGDPGTKAFDEKGFDITFDYPEEMETGDEVKLDLGAGAAAKATAAVRYDNRNGIIVQRYDLKATINKGNLEAVKPEVDKLFKQALGQSADGKATEIGGLPALEYAFTVQDRPDEESRLAVVFDGNVEYTINCQSNEERREDIEKACDIALGSVAKKS